MGFGSKLLELLVCSLEIPGGGSLEGFGQHGLGKHLHTDHSQSGHRVDLNHFVILYNLGLETVISVTNKSL